MDMNVRSGISNVWRTPIHLSFTFLVVTYYGNFYPITTRTVQTPSITAGFTVHFGAFSLKQSKAAPLAIQNVQNYV